LTRDDYTDRKHMHRMIGRNMTIQPRMTNAAMRYTWTATKTTATHNTVET